MNMSKTLRDVAHARSGDKGNISNIGVFVYRQEDYAALIKYLTAGAVAAHFRGVVHGPVLRYELPKIAGLNFVMHHALSGGVTRSLALDTHGKCLSSLLLDMQLPENFRPF